MWSKNRNLIIAVIVLLCVLIMMFFRKKAKKTIKNVGLMFDDIIKHIFINEGGYVWDKRDPGGETNYGISKRAHPNEDIKNLTKARAAEIYKNSYWKPVEALKIEDKQLAYQVFDMAVNAGVSTSLALYAKNKDLQSYKQARTEYYKKLKNFPIYGKSWLNRVNKTV